MLKRFRSLFRVVSSRLNFEDSMTEELEFHIQQRSADLERSGVSPCEAVRRARLELGGLNSVKGDCRQARGLQLFDELGRQLQYAGRLLRKAPGFTATALLTLALCLGANLTIFAAIDSILLRPLPFANAERLVTIFNTYPKANVERDGSSVTNYYERRGRIAAFSSLSIYRLDTAIVGQAGSAERQQITQVSPDFFTTLGLGPVIGRSFTEQETSYATSRVAVISDRYWRENFSADPHVIGRRLRINGFPDTIVGVLPPRFHFLSSEAQVYVPLASSSADRAPDNRHSGGNFTQMIGRLRPGATVAQAQSQIDAQNNALEVDDPQGKSMAAAGFRSLVVPLREDHVAVIRPTLLLLQAGVLFLLLIGTVNLLNLLLIRAAGRTKEHAVRQALGASRGSVVSELVVETTLLTLLGGLLGLAVGAAGIRLLAALGADRLPLGAHIAFDARLVWIALLASVVLGLVLAAPLVWFRLQHRLGSALQAETRSATTGRVAQTLRHSFIVAQIALAFMLLSGAGLLGLSLQRAMAVSPGFRPDHLFTGQVSLVGNKYPTASAGLTFTERLVNELMHQPGMVAAGVANNLPFSGHSGKSAATVKGYVLQPGQPPQGHYSYGVGGDYFRALGFSLLAGRFLTAADSRGAGRYCVVDEDFAHHYWPHSSPLGHFLFQGSQAGADSEAFTVVGVVRAVKQAGLTDSTTQGAVYYPYIYRPDSNIFVVARGSLPPESLALGLQRAVRQIDPELSVNDLRSMDTRIADSLVARRSPALLAGLFAGIALLLVAVGTYGVLSYAVAQRRREIGVRMALGARPQQIRRQFLLLTFGLLAGGTALGLTGAWLTGHAMQTVLFQVPALDAGLLAGVAGVMALTSLVACLLPAHRAAHISPMQALADH